MSDTHPKILAHEIGDHCIRGVRHSGEPTGTVEQFAGIDTYVALPPKGERTRGVVLFYADVYGPLYVNNKLLQDYFASQGFIVVGIDYFEGDPIYIHAEDKDWDRQGWIASKRARAKEILPAWNNAAKDKFGRDLKYFAVGYCFGAPPVLEVGATDEIAAGAIAHPAFLDESHFWNVKVPVFVSAAEIDHTFPVESRRRAEDILVERKHGYHFQVFSGVAHGFAVRGDPAVENEPWAKETSASGISGWFRRFAA